MKKSYERRILLSVTGMSPAVVTETLYALVTEKNFIPTEIRVITTLQGKNKLLEGLLGIEEGGRKERTGALEKFIADYGDKYGFSSIHFDESCIEVIEDEYGEKLADIRTAAENNFTANQIIQIVGQLCQKKNTALHVSIAGGRKTMGFFLGYALSLYGRKQDSLSHVLVSSQFENLRGFYYPTPYSHKIIHQGNTLDAADAKVMLAEIPWVRLGLGVSKELLNHQISYSESISKAQQMLDIPSLNFVGGLKKSVIKCDQVEIKLSPRGYTMLLAMVIAREKGIAFDYFKNNKEIRALYLSIYELLTDKDSVGETLKKVDDIDDLKSVLSDSRTDISRKIRQAFSLGKSRKIPYIPSSKEGVYRLMIDDENITVSTGIKQVIERKYGEKLKESSR